MGPDAKELKSEQVVHRMKEGVSVDATETKYDVAAVSMLGFPHPNPGLNTSLAITFTEWPWESQLTSQR